jgi:hypothetical protein
MSGFDKEMMAGLYGNFSRFFAGLMGIRKAKKDRVAEGVTTPFLISLPIFQSLINDGSIFSCTVLTMDLNEQ